MVANLFEWNWASVAKECTTVLGPAGYGAVQVAPPQDSLSRSGPPPVHPWWEVYQPVDYNLTSRMANEAQFRTMVATCRRAGVKVIVDAVINHMTGQGDTSYGVVHYSKYSYAGLYTPSDFHVPASARWICTDRTVASLVGWHNYAGGAPQANWYDDGVNFIAFSRGNRAWIAIDNEAAPVTRTFATGLSRGTYCDVIHGDAVAIDGGDRS